MTLETAKALKSAGWDKETERQWRVVDNSKGQYLAFPPPHIHNSADYLATDTLTYPNPNLEELLAVIPCVINGCYLTIKKFFYDGDTYLINYESKAESYESEGESHYDSEHPDPTEAVAQLWLKLRKEGIV